MKFARSRWRLWALSSLVLVAAGVWLALARAPRTSSAAPQPPPQAIADYGRLPARFELNAGQSDPAVKFLAHGGAATLFLTAKEPVLLLRKLARPERSPNPRELPRLVSAAAVRMKFLGAAPSPLVEALDELPGKSNYLIGNDPAKWRTDVPAYARVAYRSMYPGVDVVFHGEQGQLEYDFELAPGADPAAIRISFEGADAVSLDGEGSLLVRTAAGDLLQRAPSIYQLPDASRRAIAGRYVLHPDRSVGIDLGAYDRRLALVIDPVLVYSTYLGAGSIALGIAVDSEGNAYLAGATASPAFPTTTGAFKTTFTGANSLYGYTNAFVAKLNPAGSALVYSTFLGGTNGDDATGIAIDSTGNAYVVGATDSTDFPVTAGAFQKTFGGGGFTGCCQPGDVFVSKLNPSGTALLYSTYLGGSGWDIGEGIAIDDIGNAYVVGQTHSPNYPVTPGALLTTFPGSYGCGGNTNSGFVTALNSTGTGLVYSTFLGGGGFDLAFGIALDSGRNAYVTGFTTSGNFPVTAGSLQTTVGGGSCPYGADGFLTKLSPSGASVYSTYLGGNGDDQGNAVAVDASGNAYVTGQTGSTNFPHTAGAFQPASAGSTDAFVAKVNASGSAFVYSTLLGGAGGDVGRAISLDSSGRAYVAGLTSSSNFPLANPLQAILAASQSGFIATLNSGGTGLVFSSYLGGSTSETAYAVAVAAGEIFVAGNTSSTNFPVTAGAFQTTYAGVGGSDAFVTKISPALTCDSSTVSVATGQSGPWWGIAVDATSVYWVDYNGMVMKAPIGGGTPTTLASGQGTPPWGLAVDGSNVYWVNNDINGTVKQVPKAGGTPITLASGQFQPWGITVDATHVYWTNGGNGGTNGGTVNKVPIGGGSVTTLSSGWIYPLALAVDASNVYWVNNADQTTTSGTVMKVPKAGGTTTTLVTGLNHPDGIAIDSSNIYWTNTGTGTTDSSVMKVPLAGGTPVTLASGQRYASGIAVDATNVYWTAFGDGTVMRVPISGGTATPIAIGQADPYGLAIDATNVYWTNFAGDVAGAGSVMQAPKCSTATSSATTTALASSQSPTVYGQSVTFTATVSASGGTPGGTVAFSEGGTAISGCSSAALSAGGATCSTSALSVGTHTITATYGGDGSFNASAGTVSQTVNKDATTTTVATSSTGATSYGQSVTFTATVSANSPGNGTPSGTATFKAGSTTLCASAFLSGGVASCSTAALTAGSHTITATYNGDGNFLGSSGTTSLTVGKAALTVTADDKTKVYGSANPEFTYALSGFVNGDSSSVVSGQPALSTAATTASGVGNYAIAASLGTLAADNYSFTFAGATLAVTAASLTITANDRSKTYGQTVTFAGSEFITSALVTGDSVASVTLTSSGAAATASAGTYPIVPSAATGTGLTNYNITYDNGTLTVYKATPVITWDNPADITYGTALSSTQLNATAGGAGPAVVIPTSGLELWLRSDQGVVTDGSGNVTSWTSQDPLAHQLMPNGKAAPARLPGGAPGANDAIAFDGSTMALSTGDQVLTGNSFTIFTVMSLDGSYPGYPWVVGLDGSHQPPNGVPYRFAFEGNNPNEFIPSSGDQFEIAHEFSNDTLGHLSGIADASWKVLAAKGSGTMSSIQVYGNGVAATMSSEGSDVAIDFQKGLSLGYLYGGENVYTKVKFAEMIVYAGALSDADRATVEAYLEQKYGFAGGVSASVAGSFVYSPAAGTVLGAGSQGLHVDFTPNDTTNYTTASKDVTIKVLPATLTVNAGNAGMTYGGAVPALPYTISGFVNGDASSVVSGAPSLTTTASSASSAGTYPITLSSISGLAAANYSFAAGSSGILIVGKALLIVNAGNATMTYGGALPALPYTFSGFVNGDASSVVSGAPSLTTSATSASSAGTYPITVSSVSGLSAANYTFAAGSSGTLTVGKALLVVNAGNASMTYGGAVPSLPYTISGFVNGDGSGVVSGAASLATTATSVSPSGSYPISVSSVSGLSAANYDFAAGSSGTLTINKAKPVLAYTGALSGTYNQPAALIANLTDPASNPIAGEQVTFTLGSQSCAGATDGSGDATCTLKLTQQHATYTVAASFAGDGNFLAASSAALFDVALDPTTTQYTGATSGEFLGTYLLQALVTETSSGLPAAQGTSVHFSLGQPELQGCSAIVDAAGGASCSIQIEQPAGSYPIVASASGNQYFSASSASATFTVSADTTSLTYTGPGLIANGGPLTLSASFIDTFTHAPISAQSIVFTFGGQSCAGTSDSNGAATCTISSVAQPLGPASIAASFAGNGDYLPASASASVLVFAYVGAGSFVVATSRASAGSAVTFWGAQWAKANLTVAPAAFKGFADQPALPSCGGGFSALPGNSSKPPASVPAFMAVIASSAIAQSGSAISGDIPKLVIVQTAGGYAPNPGHAGTGTVVAVLCGGPPIGATASTP